MDDKIFKTIERLINRQIVCYHVESNRYAFKLVSPLFDNVWHTLPLDFVNSAL